MATDALSRDEQSIPWRPAVHGAVAVRAEAAVVRIADELTAADGGTLEERADGSLVTGAAGIALFLFYAARALGVQKYREAGRRALERAADWVAASPLSPSLYTGYLGVAWTVAHLGDDAATVIDQSSLDTIDAAVERHLVQYHAAFTARRQEADALHPVACEFDLLKGVTGIGLYALERAPSPRRLALLRGVLRILQASHVRVGSGCAWATDPADLSHELRSAHPGGVFKVGAAHGAAGVVSVLAQLERVQELKAEATPLLTLSISWLLNGLRTRERGACFPVAYGRRMDRDQLTVVGEAEDGPGWCNGDNGVGGVLALLFALRGDVRLLECARRLVETESETPPRATFGPSGESTHLLDTSLCHGMASHVHASLRVDRYSLGGGSARLAQRFERFLQTRLSRLRPMENGLLYGDAGIGLVLLASIDTCPPRWDAILGYSSRVCDE